MVILGTKTLEKTKTLKLAPSDAHFPFLQLYNFNFIAKLIK